MNPVAALGAAAVAVVVGTVVSWRATSRRIGGLLIAHGVSFGALLAFSDRASTGRAGMVVDQLGSGSWVLLFLWLVLVAYLVPDGSLASGFWRRWVTVGLIGVLAFMVGAAGDAPGFRDAHGGADPPLPWLPSPVSGLLGVAGLLTTVLLVFGSAFAVRARLRHASGDRRLQLLWLVWGATSLPVALMLAWVGHLALNDNPVAVDGALLLAGLALPLTIGVAVVRHRLFDIELILSRTLVYGVLTVGVMAWYGLLLLVADRLLGSSVVGGLLAVGVVAVAVHPAYAFLRARIERWVYGYRSDPTAALRKLGADVEAADPLRLVETITDSVAEALKVESVRVAGPDAAEPEDQRIERVALVHRGERIGVLLVEVPAGRTLSASDHALLRDLAHYAAVTVRAAQLATDLQASRARIVTAREEERKRLRRDLHDGVGPSLAAILLKIRAAEARRDPVERNALLAEIGAETKSAITEVRRMVDNLRPPAIDEVGLVGAIRQRAAAMSTGDLVVRVHGPERLPNLPAAVEVAVFRIASEAITNVARHARASRCTVELTVDAALGLTVSDNGRGCLPSGEPGVGWTSMRERAAEVGGTCSVSTRAEGGLVVHAELPLAKAGSGAVVLR